MSEDTLNNLNFPGFAFKQNLPDAGLIAFATINPFCSQHVEAEAFFQFQQAVDSEEGKIVEVLLVAPQSEIVVPRSLKGVSRVEFAGTWPEFKKLDANKNLIAQLDDGCVVRVEFVGNPQALKPHVKYFSTI